VATRKIVKKSTRCLNCGKTVSHDKKGPVFDMCYTCRTDLKSDDFDLQLFYEINGINRHKMCID